MMPNEQIYYTFIDKYEIVFKYNEVIKYGRGWSNPIKSSIFNENSIYLYDFNMFTIKH